MPSPKPLQAPSPLLRIFLLFTSIALALTIAAVGWVGYLLVAPMNVLTITKPQFIVQPQPVHPGEPAHVRFHVCKHTSDIGDVATTLLSDGEATFLSATHSNLPVGCFDASLVSGALPVDVQTGTYRIRASIRYQVNPLRHVSYDFVTEPFTVAPRQSSD